MQSFFKTAFGLLPLLLLLGCPNEVPLNDVNTAPQYPLCPYGFEQLAADGSCYCPEDKINIADMECVALLPGEYYSTMENCLIDKGMIIQIDSSRAHFVENGEMEYRLGVLSLQPTNSTRGYSGTQLYSISQEGLADSIYFNVGQQGYRLGLAEGYAEGNFRTTVFAGRMVHPDTIVGQFLFSSPEDPYRDPNATVCPAKFVRASPW